jgi:hypothetical protein
VRRPLALLFALGCAACRSPTQITFEAATDVPCAQLDDTYVTTGGLDILGQPLSPTAKAPQCTTAGQIGSLVVVPRGDDNALVAMEMVVGVGVPTSTCAADSSHCIVAKRALRFIPHDPLTVDVKLGLACEGVQCDPTATCVDGTCKSAVINDPGQCGGAGCGETVLGAEDGGAGDAAPDSSSDAARDATLGNDAAPDAAGDGPAEATSPEDAAPDAPINPTCSSGASGAVVVPIATTGMATATGLGQQRHFVATSCTSYFYFYPSDDGTELLTQTSTDFATWTPGDVVTLPNGGVRYGDDFAVAYAALGGKQVVHILADVEPTVGGSTDVAHGRTTIQGGHVAQPVFVSLPNTGGGNLGCNQDGPSVLITADGHVYDATGWLEHPSSQCDLNVLEAEGVDDGTTFSGTFDLVGLSVSVPTFTFAHDLVELPEAGAILGAYPDLDDQGNAETFRAVAVVSSPFDAGFGQGAPTADELFQTGSAQSWFGDWAICRLADDDVQVVRHTFTGGDAGSASAFGAMRYDGTSWSGESPPASTASPLNSGLALVSGMDPSKGLVLATVDGSGTSLNLAQWSPSTGSWTTLPSIARAAPIRALAGSGCASMKPAVFWTEGAGPTYQIVAADVSAYLR